MRHSWHNVTSMYNNIKPVRLLTFFTVHSHLNIVQNNHTYRMSCRSMDIVVEIEPGCGKHYTPANLQT